MPHNFAKFWQKEHIPEKRSLLVSLLVDLVQNSTIEERVALLEIQVDEIEEDVIIIRVDLTELEGDVNFLFDETVIQDERLLNLEETTDAINAELLVIGDELDFIDDNVESTFVKLTCVYND